MLSQYSFSRTSKEKLKHQSDDEEEIKNDSLAKSTDEISSCKDEENEDWEKTSSKDEEKAEESTSDDSADENLYFKEEKKVSGKTMIVFFFSFSMEKLRSPTTQSYQILLVFSLFLILKFHFHSFFCRFCYDFPRFVLLYIRLKI